MYIYWIAMTLLIVAGGIFSQVQHSDETVSEQATIDALSRSMLVYRSAAAEITELVGARVYAQLVEVLERPRPPALPVT